MTLVLVGIGAGLVSALLFAVVITGSPLALLLSYVAPLPILVASLGWKHRAGLVAAAAGALALAVALRPVAGITFGVGVGLPAWGIAYLALLGRTDGRGVAEWYPLGRIVLWIAGLAAAVTVAGAVAISGDHDAYLAAMKRTLDMVLTGAVPGMPAPTLPPGFDADGLATTLAALVPFAAAASFVPMIVANLWMAARAVHVSGRLPRPWPDIPLTSLPREAGFLAAAAVALSFLPGFAGVAGVALLGALTSAFALNGLAGIHQMTRGRSWRLGALVGLYVGLMIAWIWILPLIALWGLFDCLFGVRARRSGPPAAPFT
jgi:hypothetical protein